MDQYISDLFDTIKNGKMTTTYKAAWIRAIVETCVLNSDGGSIDLDQIETRMFGYYWNQTLWFDLKQSPNFVKIPEFQQVVLDSIKTYQSVHGMKPVYFSEAEKNIDVNLTKIRSILGKTVVVYFKNVVDPSREFYTISGKTLTLHRPDLIREYASILLTAINARWTSELETYNNCPSISKKVSSAADENVKRGNLTKFKKLLDLENPNHICFHTGVPIPAGEESIDHVLPWSYLYSDDVWNLVYTSKSYNSSKSNKIPDLSTIQKLESRNKRLSMRAGSYGKGMVSQIAELHYAVQSGTVKKFWVGCQ